MGARLDRHIHVMKNKMGMLVNCILYQANNDHSILTSYC